MAQISYTIFIHMLNLFEMSFLNTSRIFENFFLLKNIHGFAHLKAKEGRKKEGSCVHVVVVICRHCSNTETPSKFSLCYTTWCVWCFVIALLIVILFGIVKVKEQIQQTQKSMYLGNRSICGYK